MDALSPVVRRYDWNQTYSASDYRNLMLSYSGTQMMEESDRLGLLDDMESFIRTEFGGYHHQAARRHPHHRHPHSTLTHDHPKVPVVCPLPTALFPRKKSIGARLPLA